MGRVATASAPPQMPVPQPAAPTAAGHGVPASEQRLPDAGQRMHAPQTAGTATTQQVQAGTHRRPAFRHQTAAALQHQDQHGGKVQSPRQTPAAAAIAGEKYAARPPTGGPHVRSIFYNPIPTASVPAAASGGAADRAGPAAHDRAGMAQGQAHTQLGSGHGIAASAAQHVRPVAGHAEGRPASQQRSGAPQRLVLPAPNAVLGSTRQPNNVPHSNPAGQVGGTYAGQRHTHSAPSAAGKRQLQQRPTLPAAYQQSGATDGHVPQAIRSAPVGSAAQSARPSFQQQQQLLWPSPQQQQPDSSGSAFQRFACDVHNSMSPTSKSASARPAQPVGPAAATGGATRQQRILPSLMRGGARPAPPPARPGNEFCAVEIQLGEQTGTLEVHAKDRYFNDAAQTAMLRCGAQQETVSFVTAARRFR